MIGREVGRADPLRGGLVTTPGVLEQLSCRQGPAQHGGQGRELLAMLTWVLRPVFRASPGSQGLGNRGP